MQRTLRSMIEVTVVVAFHATAGTIAAAEPADVGVAASAGRWFASTSFWNTRLPDDAPKAPTSVAHVAYLVEQTKYTTTSSPLRGRHPPGQNVKLSEAVAVVRSFCP